MIPLELQSILKTAEYKSGIHYFDSPETFMHFEEAYLAAREKEGRLYAKEVINLLPHTLKNHPYHKEWQTRLPVILRFLNYIKEKSIKIALEIGCGNGWLSAKIAQNLQGHCLALDINQTELSEGKSVFHHVKNLHFIYADILVANRFPKESLDSIVLAGAIQYFKKPSVLIDHLLQFLNPEGEIHIFDSPFYTNAQKKAAQMRSQEYFQSLGIPHMAENFHHHTLNELAAYPYQLLYNPYEKANRLKFKLKRIPINPFPWICITKK